MTPRNRRRLKARMTLGLRAFLLSLPLAFVGCSPAFALPNEPAAPDLLWWITVVELPTLAGLFWLLWRARRDGETAREKLRGALEAAERGLREALAAYKLEVAQSYASLAHLKEAERRLTGHLVRIEDKLDRYSRDSLPSHA
ncbi:MAG: hypothetical protein ACPGNT_00925 [Rhodospirillales bacterium]